MRRTGRRLVCLDCETVMAKRLFMDNTSFLHRLFLYVRPLLFTESRTALTGILIVRLQKLEADI